MNATTNTVYSDSISLKDLASTSRDDALMEIGLADHGGRLKLRDEDGAITNNHIALTNQLGKLEDALLSTTRRKVFDIVDITDDPAEVTKELVEYRKRNTTIDGFNFGTAHNHNSIEQAFAEISRAPDTYLTALGIAFAPTPAPHPKASNPKIIEYTDTTGVLQEKSLHDIVID